MSDKMNTEKVYKELLASFPDMVQKGKSMPYTSLNGNMFSFVGKQGELAIRLSKEDQQDYMDNYGATLCLQHNSVMKGYISVPEKYFSDTEFLKVLFKKSIENVKSLKPKPTKKKK